MIKLYLSDLHIGNGNKKDDFKYDKELIKILEDLNEESKNELYIVGDGFEILQSYENPQKNNDIYEIIKNFDFDSILKKIKESHNDLIMAFRNYSKKNKIHYIVGNHDYYLLFDEKIKNKFKNFLGENVEIHPYYYDEKWEIFIIHGNQFDTLNRLTVTKTGKILPPYGELMEKFISKYFDNEVLNVLPDEILMDYDNIEPKMDIFLWLEEIRNKYSIGLDLEYKWIDMFVNFVRSKESKEWLKENYPFIHILSYLFINKIGGIKFGEILVRTISSLRGAKKTNYLMENVKKILYKNRVIPKKYCIGYSNEDILIPSKLQGIIMGHIHVPTYEIFPNNNGEIFYCNLGSWKHTVKKTSVKNKTKFLRRTQISYFIVKESNKSLNTQFVIKDMI
ncbi:metallophosphoesterase [Marinitoga hydrogenitolerans]|uniref:metallophosphoesterase n=1 Tax=Marinitoga hydrogenitolerans TaxID=287990 RepID=UPI000932B3E4|nr:metallophosphoesterase [Marinitoga hydrogenitolerans]